MCQKIAREFRPDKIILFGSYAYGRPTGDSDVDLLIIMPVTGRAIDQAIKISGSIEPRFPVDVLVRTPDEVSQRLALNDFFIKEATEKGETLHESSDARVGGGQSRRGLPRRPARIPRPKASEL
ncbi:MAG: hypothetical protein C5B50_21325 [Verrucomicrobia bacterium]|nr:MAG: hypothetical protein C5B50_21325 [Verrucomicrobiota bacterium]